MAALFIVFYFTGHSHLLLLSRTLHGECVFLSRIIQNYSSDWLFCLWTEISDMSCVVWISGVSEGEGGKRGKENQKGRQWREKKLFTLFPLLLSLAPKEGHILKLDSRFMAAALKLFFFRSVKVNEYSCFSKYSSQVSVYEICSIIVSQSFSHWRTSFLP